MAIPIGGDFQPPDFTGAPDDVVKTNEPYRETTGQASEATGVTANPTTSSSTFATLTNMSVLLVMAGGNVFVTFSGSFDTTAGSPGNLEIRVMRDSATQVGPSIIELFSTNGDNHFLSMATLDISPPIGEHTYTVEWRSVNNTTTMRAIGTSRQIQVQELA